MQPVQSRDALPRKRQDVGELMRASQQVGRGSSDSGWSGNCDGRKIERTRKFGNLHPVDDPKYKCGRKSKKVDDGNDSAAAADAHGHSNALPWQRVGTWNSAAAELVAERIAERHYDEELPDQVEERNKQEPDHSWFHGS